MTVGLTPYITPAILMSSSLGISWNTFPSNGTDNASRVATLLDICSIVTSEMDTIANLTLRATVDTETEYGPDWIITILPNGWARFRLSNWPITQIVSAQVSPASSVPPSWVTVPINAIQTEHAALPNQDSIIPSGASPGATAALIGPGYINWSNGRKGWVAQITTINGFPVAGLDQTATQGSTTIHVDDVTGWWNPTVGLGARGVIYDYPYRETVEILGASQDDGSSVLGISGPGTLTLSQGLQFTHTPSIGVTNTPDQRILLSSMPPALIQAANYLAVHYGLIRGTTAAVVQTGRGQVTTSGLKGAMDWYEQASRIIERFGRVL
jgi:hypothetical protein